MLTVRNPSDRLGGDFVEATRSQGGTVAVSYSEWNKLLFDHFFQRQPDDHEPVTHLMVTGDEIRRATSRHLPGLAATFKTGDDAANHFIERMRTFRGNSPYQHFLEDAASERKDHSRRPQFFAALALACLAATDDDGAWNEHSYLMKLRQITGDDRTSSQGMSDAWRALQHWLDQVYESGLISGNGSNVYFRRLILPSQRGFAQIGYTLRLAFPRARDFAALAAVIRPLGLEPTAVQVIAAINRSLSSFTAPFIQDHFRPFEAQVTGNLGGFDLARSMFWSAVSSATERVHQDNGANFGLLVESSDDDAQVIVVARRDDLRTFDAGDLRFVAEPSIRDFGWTHIAECIHDDDVFRVAASKGGPVSAAFAAVVALGRVLLREVAPGTLSWPLHGETPSQYALVRVRESSAGVSAAPGWLLTERDPGTAAAAAQSVRFSQIFVRAGLPASGGGYLAIAEFLPEATAPFAKAVSYESLSGESVSLVNDDADVWRFPRNTALHGDAHLVARYEDGSTVRRKISFGSSAVLGPLATPSPGYFGERAGCEPARHHIYDGDVGSVEPDRLRPCAVGGQTSEPIEVLSEVRYIGPLVGVFRERQAPGFPACVWHEAGRLRATYDPRYEDLSLPVAKTTNAGSNRAWRNIVSALKSVLPQHVYPEYRRRIDPSLAQNETAWLATPPPRPGPPRPGVVGHSERREALDLTEAVAAALRARRSPRSEAFALELIQRALRADAEEVPPIAWSILRSLAEIGAIDILQRPRNRGRDVFGVAPHFVVHRSRGAYVAVLTGIVTKELRDRVAAEANKFAEVSVSNALSSWIPGLLRLVLADSHELDQFCTNPFSFARPVRLRALPELAIDLRAATDPNRHAARDSQLAIHRWYDWPTRRFAAQAQDDGDVQLAWRRNERGADVYEVLLRDVVVARSHLRHVATFVAATLRNEGPILPTSPAAPLIRTCPQDATLPLGVARYLAFTSSATPGPADARDVRHQYAAPRPETWDEIATLLRFSVHGRESAE